jgi:hypothetical protein
MVKNHESFTIDNTKLRAREAQITGRFGEFVRATEDRFAGEATDRYNVLTTFGEDLDSKVRGLRILRTCFFCCLLLGWRTRARVRARCVPAAALTPAGLRARPGDVTDVCYGARLRKADGVTHDDAGGREGRRRGRGRRTREGGRRLGDLDCDVDAQAAGFDLGKLWGRIEEEARLWNGA